MFLYSNHMQIYIICDSVEGSGARWARSAVLHTLTISTTTSANSHWIPCTTSENAEKVLKGSNYDGTAGSSPILNGMPDYEALARSPKTPTEINWMMA